MKRYILFLTLIVSLSVGCTDFEPVSPYAGLQVNSVSYHQNFRLNNADCVYPVEHGIGNFDVYDEGIDVNISINSIDSQASIVCLSPDAILKPGEGFVQLFYNDTTYHSFKGGIWLCEDLNKVYVDAFFYKKMDRTYTPYRINIGINCK